MKILIVGTADGTKLNAPYDDPAYLVWSLAGNYDSLPRADRFFELHSIEHLRAVGISEKHMSFLKAQGETVTLQKAHPDYPDAKVFPHGEMIERFGDYFTNSVAWLLALAIAAGPEEIFIAGVHMDTEEEYAHQRPCCEYYIGLARGMGIKVTIAEGSPLARSGYLYAVDPEKNGAVTSLMQMLRESGEAKAKAEREMEEAAAKVNYFKGANDVLTAFRNKL